MFKFNKVKGITDLKFICNNNEIVYCRRAALTKLTYRIDEMDPSQFGRIELPYDRANVCFALALANKFANYIPQECTNGVNYRHVRCIMNRLQLRVSDAVDAHLVMTAVDTDVYGAVSLFAGTRAFDQLLRDDVAAIRARVYDQVRIVHKIAFERHSYVIIEVLQRSALTLEELFQIVNFICCMVEILNIDPYGWMVTAAIEKLISMCGDMVQFISQICGVQIANRWLEYINDIDMLTSWFDAIIEVDIGMFLHCDSDVITADADGILI